LFAFGGGSSQDRNPEPAAGEASSTPDFTKEHSRTSSHTNGKIVSNLFIGLGA
jgi:hypothetical protein